MQLRLVELFPRVGQLAGRFGQLVGYIGVPRLHIGIAFGDLRGEVTLHALGLLFGGFQVALHLNPGVHRGQRVDLAADVQMLQLLAHVFQRPRIGQPAAIGGNVAFRACDGCRHAVGLLLVILQLVAVFGLALSIDRGLQRQMRVQPGIAERPVVQLGLQP